MPYVMADEQFEKLSEYFELALTAISDDEQVRLLSMEKPLRDMLRGIKSAQQGTPTPGAGRTDQS